MTPGEEAAGRGSHAGGAISLMMTLPAIPDVELVAIEGLNRLARHLGTEEEKLGEARILVAEAVINALEHSGGEGHGVEVEFTLTTKELVILVRDHGTGFHPNAVENPTIESRLGADRKRGWGLKLMRSMSDDFNIESGPQGTTITIRKVIN